MTTETTELGVILTDGCKYFPADDTCCIFGCYRCDEDPSKGSPWARVEYKKNSGPGHEPEPLTEEEIEQKLESGEINLEEVRELADQQLAEQNPETERGVANDNSDIVLGRVAPRPEQGEVTERQRGFAADLFIPRIHLKQ